MVSVACSHCGRMLHVGEELIGQEVKCPCGQLVAVARNNGAPATVGEETSALPPSDDPERVTTSGLETRGDGEAKAAPAKELYDFLAPPQSAEELGRLGLYRVLKVLGTGGMGIVFQAENTLLNRPVALKAMLSALAANNEARLRFFREAQAAAALKDDHIVTLYEVGEHCGVPFIVMELLEGEALDARLRREGALPIAEVMRIGREIAEGLTGAHQRGLIHRDIKPANIWLEGERRRVKILDFGLARIASGDVQLTRSGMILGSPAYMAPEQARSEKVDARTDLFSLGCVLYHMATGQMPFQGKDAMSMLMALAVDTPLPPRQLRTDCPPPLSELIQQLLSKNVSGRPGSAEEVVKALWRIERGQPLEAWPIRIAQPAGEPPPFIKPASAGKDKSGARSRSRKRSRPASCLLTVVFLLLGLVGCGGFCVPLFFYLGGGSRPTMVPRSQEQGGSNSSKGGGKSQQENKGGFDKMKPGKGRNPPAEEDMKIEEKVPKKQPSPPP